jgi:poly(U)-specific endoribonuclease
MKQALKQLWFAHYSRARGMADTSGFEHIFVGEAKNGEISGLHNWLKFYSLERNASENFDYQGFLVKRGVGQQQQVKIKKMFSQSWLQ